MALRAFGDFWDWDPFRDLDRLRAGMGARGGTSDSPGDPPVSIWENDQGLVLAAELPGVEPGQIDISVADDTVTLSGTRPEEKLEDGSRLLHRERSHGGFERSFALPYPVDTDAVEARFANGMLHLTLPKSAAHRPRKIAIHAS